MNDFHEWYETYERDGGELMVFNSLDLEQAFKAGMKTAMKIAEDINSHFLYRPYHLFVKLQSARLHAYV